MPLITNDAVVLGLLLVILGFIFWSASSNISFFKKFYKYVPTLLLCYFIPSIFSSLGIISGKESQLYFVSSRYLLPACLVLLTLSTDLKEVFKLGPKALIMFFTGTFSIVIGGPIALLITSALFPDLLGVDGPEAVWRGLTTLAGSWIGGGANQTAMKEVYQVGDNIFSSLIAVDILVANTWMAILLYFAGAHKKMDSWLKADSSSISKLQTKMEDFQKRHARIPALTDLKIILAVAFGITAIGHLGADTIAPWIQNHAPHLAKFSLTSKFFWLIVIATTGGMLLSFTKARKLEGAGASRVGSAFLYILIASIGMKMNIKAIVGQPALFLLGFIWIAIHGLSLLVTAKIIRAPVFFLAVGSQANVGGAASAPVVAGAFHPSLAPVGVLLAVFGYVLGTYGAWLCGQLLRVIAVS